MPAIVKNQFRIHQADQFIETLTEGGPDDRYYLFVAKDAAWSGADAGLYTEASPSDTTPPTPKDTFQSDFILWDNIISGKLLGASDVSRVVKRVDWTTATVYPQYEHQTDDLPTNDFFVVNVDGANTNVYKCISNAQGANSTVAPTGQSTSIITTGDGYRWKYMYTLTASQFEKFVTDDWIPVQTLTSDDGSIQWDVQQAAVDGALNFIDIVDGGSGGSDGPQAVTLVGSDGTGFVATATVASGAVASISISNAGTDERLASSATVATVGGSLDLRPKIEPFGGHGANPVVELGGFFVMINIKFRDTEGGDFVVGDDFRIIGIMKNPQTNSSGAFTDATFGSADIGAGASQIDIDTGEILYTEFRTPVIRDASQTEDVKLVIGF